MKRTTENGSYEIGPFINDSLFHGIVTRYNANNEYEGYSTYRYGIKNGTFINSYRNGTTKDSIMFSSGKKNGFSFSFDSHGKISYKINFIDDRPVGDSYIFDTNGKINCYGFRGLEGDFIYYLKYTGGRFPYSTGNLFNYKMDTIWSESSSAIKFHLLTYLIKPPDLQVEYYLAEVYNEQILSKTIIENDVFFESDLELLDKDHFYAVVVAVFNNPKNKFDYIIHVLK